MSLATALCLAVAPALVLSRGNTLQPNPPPWPPSVRVFSPSDTDVVETVEAAFKVNGGSCTAGTLQCPPGQWLKSGNSFPTENLLADTDGFPFAAQKSTSDLSVW